eukprot:365885-Chlamydomonas_euryale.AAC.5
MSTEPTRGAPRHRRVQGAVAKVCTRAPAPATLVAVYRRWGFGMYEGPSEPGSNCGKKETRLFVLRSHT